MDYWTRQTKPNPDLIWSLPEQKTGTLQIIGGHSSSFAPEIKLTEFLANFNLREIRLILPSALQRKLPPLPNLIFTPSTDSGSFAKSPELIATSNSADATLILGDLSKNSETAIAIAEVIKSSNHPVVITRDTIDLVATEMPHLLDQSNLTLVATFAQLQKLLRTIYYPKMLLLSMPLAQAVDTLHKFTLSYPCTILTWHQEHIVIAHGGKITTIPLQNTDYTPISLLSGQLAAKLAALSVWLPNQPYQNAIAAIHWSGAN